MKESVSYVINVISASLLIFNFLARVKPGILFIILVELHNKKIVL